MLTVLTICTVPVFSAPCAICPEARPRAGIVDGTCAVQGQLGEHWKLMTVLLDEYLVNRAGGAACTAMRQCEYKGRREQG